MLIGILFGTVVVIAIYVWAMVCVHRNQKQMKHADKQTGTDYLDSNSCSGLDLSAKLMLGAMGAKLLDNQVEKHKQEREKRRHDSLYWQEAIRDKNQNHDIDYDHEDD